MTQSTVSINGELASCCADRGNRVRLHPDPAPGFSVELCMICERRHTTLNVKQAVAHQFHE